MIHFYIICVNNQWLRVVKVTITLTRFTSFLAALSRWHHILLRYHNTDCILVSARREYDIRYYCEDTALIAHATSVHCPTTGSKVLDKLWALEAANEDWCQHRNRVITLHPMSLNRSYILLKLAYHTYIINCYKNIIIAHNNIIKNNKQYHDCYI